MSTCSFSPFPPRLLAIVFCSVVVALACPPSEAAAKGHFAFFFKFKIDPSTPVMDLLPTPPGAPPRSPTPLKLPSLFGNPLPTLGHPPLPPRVVRKASSWSSDNLAQVPELTLGKPLSRDTHDAMEKTAHIIAKINHLNERKPDGFFKELIAHRRDLRGLPFLMGNDCRTNQEQAELFSEVVAVINNTMFAATLGQHGEGMAMSRVMIGEDESGPTTCPAQTFWKKFPKRLTTDNSLKSETRLSRSTRCDVERATVAALMQILMPKSEDFRFGLANYLSTIQHVDATHALARLAIFSPEETVRAAAVEGLRHRSAQDYSEILMRGFRYPLPVVALRAADALVKLHCKDLLPDLVRVLDHPDPRLPSKRQVGNTEVSYVRELVRINHHHNCLLCHAPGNTQDVPGSVLTAPVPLPNEPLRTSPRGGYEGPRSSDILVRIDMTYLRQDYSLMINVDDAKPWPDMQRFDFFVRTRILTPEEAAERQEVLAEMNDGRMSPYHLAALFALRVLSGQDTQSTPQAWRHSLKLPPTKDASGFDDDTGLTPDGWSQMVSPSGAEGMDTSASSYREAIVATLSEDWHLIFVIALAFCFTVWGSGCVWVKCRHQMS